MTSYDIISIVHRASFLRDPSKGSSYFVNEFSSRVYFLIFEVNYPRFTQQFQIGDWRLEIGFYTRIIL